jgi:hypothetical protein
MSFSTAYIVWFIITTIILLKVWVDQLLINRKDIIRGELHGLAITHLTIIFIPVVRDLALIIMIGAWTINRIGDIIAYTLVKLLGEDADAS